MIVWATLLTFDVTKASRVVRDIGAMHRIPESPPRRESPVIPPAKSPLPRKALLVPLLSLLLTGADGDCDKDVPPVSAGPDHAQKWIGRYDGAADLFNCSDGTNSEDLSTFVTIVRNDANQVHVLVQVERGLSGDFTSGAIISADGSARLSGRAQTGNYIDEISLTMSGNVLTGSAISLRQTTEGAEYCTYEATINVRYSANP